MVVATEKNSNVDTDDSEEPSITVSFSRSKIRQLGLKLRPIGGFTSTEADAFILLHGSQLSEVLTECATAFITDRLRQK